MFSLKLDGLRLSGLLAKHLELRNKPVLEIATYLKVSKETIYKRVQHNQIPASQWRFNRKTVYDWLKVQSTFHFSQGKVENE